MRSRSGAGKGTVAKARTRGWSAVKSTSAASAPSRLVPDINPAKSATLLEAGGRRGAHEVHRRAGAGGHARELGPQGRGDRVGLGKRHAERILEDARDAELVMQVRPRRPSGMPDVADHLALGDTSAGVNPGGEAREVAVERGDAAAVLELD